MYLKRLFEPPRIGVGRGFSYVILASQDIRDACDRLKQIEIARRANCLFSMGAVAMKKKAE